MMAVLGLGLGARGLSGQRRRRRLVGLGRHRGDGGGHTGSDHGRRGHDGCATEATTAGTSTRRRRQARRPGDRRGRTGARSSSTRRPPVECPASENGPDRHVDLARRHVPAVGPGGRLRVPVPKGVEAYFDHINEGERRRHVRRRQDPARSSGSTWTTSTRRPSRSRTVSACSTSRTRCGSSSTRSAPRRTRRSATT